MFSFFVLGRSLKSHRKIKQQNRARSHLALFACSAGLSLQSCLCPAWVHPPTAVGCNDEGELSEKPEPSDGHQEQNISHPKPGRWLPWKAVIPCLTYQCPYPSAPISEPEHCHRGSGHSPRLQQLGSISHCKQQYCWPLLFLFLALEICSLFPSK